MKKPPPSSAEKSPSKCLVCLSSPWPRAPPLPQCAQQVPPNVPASSSPRLQPPSQPPRQPCQHMKGSSTQSLWHPANKLCHQTAPRCQPARTLQPPAPPSPHASPCP